MNTKETKEAIKVLEGMKDGNVPSSYSEFCQEYNEKLDKVIELLQRGEKIEGKLIQFLEKENPYSEDVFLPIPKEDFDKINDRLKKEMDYSIDRLSGNMGRRIYKSIIEEIKEMIK